MDRTLVITSDGKTFQVRSALTHLEVYSICKSLCSVLEAGQDPFPNPELLTGEEAQRLRDDAVKKARTDADHPPE